MKTLFTKLGNCYIVDSAAKIENATFPYKTALSEADVTANRLGSTKWTYHQEPVTTLFFRKF